MAASTPSRSGALRAASLPGPARALRASHLAAAVELITEPWCNTVLRAAFLGVRRFDAFQAMLKAPRQTLSLRLAYLVDIGLLEKRRPDPGGLRLEYRLTDAGLALYGSVLASWSWDRRWGDPQHPLPVRLQHRPCGHAFRPVLVCEHCLQPLTLAQARPQLLPVHRADPTPRERGRRWRDAATQGAQGPRRDILAVIDDRWSILLVAALMLGASHFDELTDWLGISSAVLARRLHRLCQMGVIGRVQDPADARRARYRLDRAGRALFPHVMVLAQWGGTRTRRRDSLQWIHAACGQPVQGRMACSHCLAPLLPREVERPRQAFKLAH